MMPPGRRADAPAIVSPVIAGPTAGGKTTLAIEVARRLGEQTGEPGEIVSADSMQIYLGMDIGSAKPTPSERRGVPHHLIDVADPAEQYTVSDWLDAAEVAIGSIRARGSVPVIAGGTHLYIKALLDGLFEGPDPDPELRQELMSRETSVLRAELERVDRAAAARIHPNDRRRTVRALEVFRQTGTPISDLQRQWDGGKRRPDLVLVGLDWPAELINRRINARVRAMMDSGLLDEVRSLHEGGRLGPQAREALGYKQLIRFLNGSRTLDEAVEQIKIETRRFAKSQRTWLRRLRPTAGSLWIDGASTPEDQWPQMVTEHCLLQRG
jgi:tRNA dimethylallyltransferase